MAKRSHLLVRTRQLNSGTWPRGKCTATLSGHTDNVEAVAFSPDGKLLASSGNDFALWLWDVTAGKSIAQLSKRTSSDNLTFSPDGKTIIVADSGNIHYWDVQTKKESRRIKLGLVRRERLFPHCLAYDKKGKLLAIVMSLEVEKVWDVAADKSLHDLKYPRENIVQCVAFSPDRKVLASADRGLCLWDIASGRVLVNQ